MGRTTKGRRVDSNVGKGKVTPVQVAFIVDRYLADNNYSETRSAFRTEASSLIAKSSLQEAPKTLLSLGAMLDEYIRLKEQKVILDQEKCRVEQEKLRVQTLLQGMQDVMNAYNSGTATTTTAPCLTPPPPPPPPPSAPAVPSSSGYPAYRNPVMASVSMTHSVKVDHGNFSTPIVSSRPPRKRKIYKDTLEVPPAPKKVSSSLPNNQSLNKGRDSVEQSNNASNGADHTRQQSSLPESSAPNYAHGGSPIQGSNVAKNLFNKPSQSPTSNSSGPKTPPRAASSQSDKSISPLEEVSSTAKSHHNNAPMEATSTNCTIISSKTIIVSPAKHFSIERNHCTFSSPSKASLKRQTKREHVKGRLDFDGAESDMPICLDNTAASGDGSSTSESEKEGDIFDLDLPNFDHAFGPDFCLTELLTDFGIDCGTFDYSCPTTSGTSIDEVPRVLCETNSGELGASPNLLEHSSSVTEVFTGDINQKGGESMTSVKSITRCIRMVSPSKSTQNCSANDQENTAELISEQSS